MADRQVRLANRQLTQGAGRQDIDMVTKALNDGANVNAVSIQGHTALHALTSGGVPSGNGKLLPIADLLISRGANVNAKAGDGMTPLMWAVLAGNIEMMKRLLNAGADITIKHSNGQTALDMAREEFPQGVRLIEERQAAANPITATASAVASAVAPAPAPTPDEDDKLIFAVRLGDIDGVRAALAAGADVNTMVLRNTPLHSAVSSRVDLRHKMYPIVDLLLEKGANVNAQRSDDRHTPFTMSFRDPMFFYALFQKRPDLTLKIKEEGLGREETPLQYAQRIFEGKPEKRYLADVIAKAELGEWDGAIAIAREESSGEQRRLRGRDDLALSIPPITLVGGYATGESDGDAMDAVDVKEVYVAKLGRDLTPDQFFRKYMGDGAVFKVGPKFYGIPRKDLLKEYLEGSAIVYECTKTFAMDDPRMGAFEYSDIYADPYYALRTPAGVLYLTFSDIRAILGTTHSFFGLEDKPSKKLENIASRSSVFAGGPVSSQLHCQAGSDGNVYRINFLKLPEIEEEEENDEEDEPNVVFVKKGEDKTEFPLDLSQTVLQLKEAVKEKLGIAVEAQKMVFQGKVLKDDQTLGEANVKKGYVIQLQVSGGRKFTRKQCKKTACKKMGFTQKASCRPYKNCYRHSAGVQKKRRTHKRHGSK